MPSPASSDPRAGGLLRATAPLVGPVPAGAAPWTVVWEATGEGGRGRLVWSGPADAAPGRLLAAAAEAPALRLSPALTEHHVHGGDGVDLATSPPDRVRAWLAARRDAGVGRTLGSLPALPTDALAEALARLRPAWEEGLLAGVHLEGPFLSPARAGAHDPAVLCAPDSPDGQAVRAVLRAQPPGFVRTLTLAPELPAAAALAAELTAAGVVVCLGHTDADGPAVERVLDEVERARTDTAGGRPRPTPVVTHLFNAMRPFHHRDPGPLPTLLDAARRGRLRLELVADGVHVDRALLSLLLADPDLAPRLCLVSDAVAATGAPPGSRHPLGPVRIHAGADAPRLGPGRRADPSPEASASPPPLAGGAAPLPVLVGRLLAAGADPDAVLRAATHVPAETLAPLRPGDDEHAADGHVLVWSPTGDVSVLRP